jgi:hypothetical protein
MSIARIPHAGSGPLIGMTIVVVVVCQNTERPNVLLFAVEPSKRNDGDDVVNLGSGEEVNAIG